MNAPGRLTARGGEAVEALVARILREAAHAMTEVMPSSAYRAVVLIGGYGRGEGGVELVGGEERPHNNLDLLVITRRGVRGAPLAERLRRAVAPLSEVHRIGLDVGWVGEGALRRAPCLVMWYDMRFGHRTVLGDPSFVPSLRRFSLDRVLSSDVRNLLVNRGTLLVINDLLLARGDLGETERRIVVKHAMKAIIGFGDAALFFDGAYDASYVRKQQRMRASATVDSAFKELYDEAMEFRFRPTYAEYLGRDLDSWSRSLRAHLEPVHLGCEARRLGRRDLTWSEYLDVALRSAPIEPPWSPRALAGRAVALARSEPAPARLSPAARLGHLCLSPRQRLPLLFPAVAYDVGEQGRCIAASSLGAADTSAPALCRAFLRGFRDHGDANFERVRAGLELDVDEGGRP